MSRGLRSLSAGGRKSRRERSPRHSYSKALPYPYQPTATRTKHTIARRKAIPSGHRHPVTPSFVNYTFKKAEQQLNAVQAYPNALTELSAIGRYRLLIVAGCAALVLETLVRYFVGDADAVGQLYRVVGSIGLAATALTLRRNDRTHPYADWLYLFGAVLIVGDVAIHVGAVGLTPLATLSAYLYVTVLAVVCVRRAQLVAFLGVAFVLFMLAAVKTDAPEEAIVTFFRMQLASSILIYLLVAYFISANSRIRRHQRLTQSLFEQANDGFAYADTQTLKLLGANPKLRALCQVDDSEELVQFGLRVFKRICHRDGQRPRDAIRDILEGAGWRKTVTIVGAKGGEFSADIVVRRICDADHDVIGVRLSDVTQRVQAEDELRRRDELLDHSQSLARMGGWEMDLRTGEVRGTRTIYDLFGRAPGSRLALDDPGVYASAEDHRRLTAAIAACAERGEHVDVAVRLNAAHGALSIRVIAEPGYERGEVTHITGVTVDISDRVQREADLRKAKEAAEAAAVARARFLAKMSHEIRTPMNGVIGMTTLVLDSDLTAEQREHLQIVRACGDALLTIINDILDFSKIDADQIVLEQRPFDFQACVAEAVEMVRSSAASKRLMLTAHTRKAAGTFVGDKGRIRQVLVNLLTNAIKFTENGSVTVNAGVTKNGDGTARLRVAVTDTGIGIPQENLDKIFDPFVQNDASTTRKYGGTGLGLSISRSLAREMGGQIEVKSEPGTGSEFTFYAVVRVGLPEVPGPAAIQDAGSTRPLEDMKVLLAEDNVVNQKLARRMLQKLGAEIDVAGNGRDAISMLGQYPYPLVLMDVQMPELDGLEATRCIRVSKQLTQPYIIAMTATAMAEDRQACFDAGMNDFIAKPVLPADMRAAIDLALNKLREQPPAELH